MYMYECDEYTLINSSQLTHWCSTFENAHAPRHTHTYSIANYKLFTLNSHEVTPSTTNYHLSSVFAFKNHLRAYVRVYEFIIFLFILAATRLRFFRLLFSLSFFFFFNRLS